MSVLREPTAHQISRLRKYMTQMEEKPEDRSWYYANKSAFLSVLLTMEAQAYFIPEEFIRYRAKIDGVIR